MTNVTLRQAHKLVEKIHAKMKDLSITPQREISLWGDIEAEVASQTAEFHRALERQKRLTRARQEIRNGIQLANYVEVDQLVAKRKALIDELGIIRHVVDDVREKSIYDIPALKMKAEATRTAASGGHAAYVNDGLSVCVLSADELTAMRSEMEQLQLQVEAVEDQLTAANSSRVNMVSLSAETVETLKAENLMS